MLPRVWAPDLDRAEQVARLPADESAHVTRVLRLGPGAPLLVFDGRGAQYLGTITATDARAGAETGAKARATTGRATTGARSGGARADARIVTVTLGDPVPAAAEPRAALTLAQAVLKGDKMEAVVRDATMMGVSRVVPLVTTRTVVPLSALERGGARDRWHRVAVASAKQCGRAVVPEIDAPSRLAPWLAAPPQEKDADADEIAGELRLLLVEPSAQRPLTLPSPQGEREAAPDPTADRSPSAPLPAQPPSRVLMVIGPEGGWSPEEIAAARAAGYQPWTLGARTLRAESAALAALSVLTYVWQL